MFASRTIGSCFVRTNRGDLHCSVVPDGIGVTAATSAPSRFVANDGIVLLDSFQDDTVAQQANGWELADASW